MLTQFFGNYLVDKNVITSDQLLLALRHKHENNKTVAAMAVSSGYMTEEEVEDVKNMQQVKDIDFTALALELNYLTNSQAEELEKAHHFGYLLLARSIVELGFCTMEKMSNEIADYEFDYSLSFSSCMNFDEDKIQEMMHSYYQFPFDGEITPAEEYVVLLMRNIIRFVGDDFRMAGKLDTLPNIPDMCANVQYIAGGLKGKTAVIGYKEFIKKFANRYSGEELENEEYVDAAIQDFLNQHNGLFSMLMSDNYDIEIELNVTQYQKMDESEHEYMYILPIEFTFGTVYFCFSL